MELERIGGVAVLKINEGKGNAIDHAFLDALNAKLDALGDARSLVIIGHESFFSAGLNIPKLVELEQSAMRAFIERFNATMLRLFSVEIGVVAAVNGHAIAGGCVLALQADVRLMADDGAKIGLNEVMLGIGLPTVVVETLRAQVPAASLVPIALEGRVFSPQEARALGLVDELCPRASLFERALERAKAMAENPRTAQAAIKHALRAPAIRAISSEPSEDAARWTSTWFSPEGQERLRAAAARLKK